VKFAETSLDGVVVVECTPSTDERGSFMRTFDASLWREHGLDPAVVQTSVSRNTRRGTLRGLHFQAEPHAEPKLVRCSRGAIFDVAVDLRRDSPTYCGWYGLELTSENGLMLQIAPGFAHGFLTLADDTEVAYQIATAYEPSAGRGVRWDDPAFAVDWPLEPIVISERDATYPDFAP
jgi:dTDP-4-dehydrorhamnose 3,5-epimerase